MDDNSNANTGVRESDPKRAVAENHMLVLGNHMWVLDNLRNQGLVIQVESVNSVHLNRSEIAEQTADMVDIDRVDIHFDINLFRIRFGVAIEVVFRDILDEGDDTFGPRVLKTERKYTVL